MRPFLSNVTGLEIKLVAQQPVCRGIDMFALRIGIEADQTILEVIHKLPRLSSTIL